MFAISVLPTKCICDRRRCSYHSFSERRMIGRVATHVKLPSVRPNHSLERTQPQRDFMYDVAMLRRSARSR